jgi:Dolichyl-phosphate-mannose-protein mannosyltransferase
VSTLRAILAGWLLLAGTALVLAWPQASRPGLFYDEAHGAAMARDFLTGRAHPHLPGSAFLAIGARLLPTFVQSYGGALKSWLLLPSFAVFGASQPVLRRTALGFALAGLLLFMLWTGRWLGRDTALLAGALLALDPAWFFVNVLDWGPVFPSFVCRFACFYFALRAWQAWSAPGADARSGSLWALFAGLFAGLGFFNKVDFAVILAGIVLALACCHARRIGSLVASRPRARIVRPLALASLGFLLTAGPMLTHVPRLLGDLSNRGAPEPGQPELAEKLDVAAAMYDGTYFYRLMDQGGMFDRMNDAHPPIRAPLGVALAIAAGVLIAGRAGTFILLAALFITVGVFAMPGAVRIHHWVAVYPFPHLAVALAVTRLSERRSRWLSATAAALVALLLASQLAAILGTQRLIRETGGRGWWSDALTAFAGEVRDRSDLTIASLDWGFGEPLAFLTDGPTLVEPFWSRDASLERSPDTIFLVHPPEYRLFGFGEPMLVEARSAPPASVELRAWRDHQGQVAFYSVRWLQSEAAGNTRFGALPR